MADADHTGCAQCGAPTKVFSSSGRAARFCGATCDAAFRAKDVRPRKWRRGTCERCGNTYQTQQRKSRFCSPECWAQHQRSTPRPPLPNDTACRRCGAGFRRNRNRTTFCSRDCAREHYASTARDRSEVQGKSKAAAALDRAAAKREAKRAKEVAVLVPCKGCGAQFRPAIGMGYRYCSQACAQLGYAAVRIEARRRSNRSRGRLSKHIQRAKRYGAQYESFDPIKVLDRDGWRCMMCGVPTPSEHRGTLRPDAPELDHVIAISLGGAHSMANTQCACRRCNCLKGAKPQAEGMPLVA